MQNIKRVFLAVTVLCCTLVCSDYALADVSKIPYRVGNGESCATIGARKGLDAELIALMNNVDEQKMLSSGQVIYLPQETATAVTVHTGDTVWSIAQTFGCSVQAVLAENNIADAGRLKVGQVLSLPLSNSAAVPVLASRSAAEKFIQPVQGRITSRYGIRKSGFHHGLDIAAAKGAKIQAAAAGQVVFVGWYNRIYGRAVVLDHGRGIKTLYAHMTNTLVDLGTTVQRGDFIGTVGATGNATGPHLHWEVRVKDKAKNPENYLHS